MDDDASTHYILPTTVMASMSAFLDFVINKFHHVLTWLQTDESVDSLRMTNAAIRATHLSLRRYICQQECFPDAYAHPDTYATAGPSTDLRLTTIPCDRVDTILPGCRGLCAPFFGLETWPQNNHHWHRIDLSALPDCALRDRNWVPIATPLQRFAELRAEQGSGRHELGTASPLQRFLASMERGDILPTSCRPRAPAVATDTGYASSESAYQAGGYASSSSSTSFGRKRRRYAADIPHRRSSSPEPDGPEFRRRKRTRRRSSFPYIVPAHKTTALRSMSAPSALSAICLSHESSSEWEGMDVEADADASGYREMEEHWTNSNHDTSDTSGSDIIGDGGAAAPEDDMDARPGNTLWWGDAAAAATADSPVEDHSPKPSRWLRMLWKLFDWRG